jgi:IS5 family transposase
MKTFFARCRITCKKAQVGTLAAIQEGRMKFSFAENIGKSVTWHVAMKRAKRKALPKNKLGRVTEKLEHLKASVRAKIEHPFHVIKNLFRHRKTRYRGLAKNTAQLFTLFGFANLVLAGRRFTVTETRRAS